MIPGTSCAHVCSRKALFSEKEDKIYLFLQGDLLLIKQSL